MLNPLFFQYFRYPNVHFVIVSDNVTWCKQHLNFPEVHIPEEVREEQVDLALLTITDHVIQTHGTFGYWGSILGPSDREILYFRNGIRRGSKLDRGFKASDYYLPHWIPYPYETECDHPYVKSGTTSPQYYKCQYFA